MTSGVRERISDVSDELRVLEAVREPAGRMVEGQPRAGFRAKGIRPLGQRAAAAQWTRRPVGGVHLRKCKDRRDTPMPCSSLARIGDHGGSWLRWPLCLGWRADSDGSRNRECVEQPSGLQGFGPRRSAIEG